MLAAATGQNPSHAELVIPDDQWLMDAVRFIGPLTAVLAIPVYRRRRRDL
jgi:hypothetical protein